MCPRTIGVKVYMTIKKQAVERISQCKCSSTKGLAISSQRTKIASRHNEGLRPAVISHAINPRLLDRPDTGIKFVWLIHESRQHIWIAFIFSKYLTPHADSCWNIRGSHDSTKIGTKFVIIQNHYHA